MTLKVLVIVLLACMSIWLIQDIWIKEMKRQDYCSQGGIGDGGAICWHHGGLS